jgi:hypothetical protein
MDKVFCFSFLVVVFFIVPMLLSLFSILLLTSKFVRAKINNKKLMTYLLLVLFVPGGIIIALVNGEIFTWQNFFNYLISILGSTFGMFGVIVIREYIVKNNN